MYVTFITAAFQATPRPASVLIRALLVPYYRICIKDLEKKSIDLAPRYDFPGKI